MFVFLSHYIIAMQLRVIPEKKIHGGDLTTHIELCFFFFSETNYPWIARRGSSIGSVSAWHASGPEFDPHVQHIFSWRLGHENISMAILPLPLIQEEQLSVTGEKKCALSIGKLLRGLAQEQCG